MGLLEIWSTSIAKDELIYWVAKYSSLGTRNPFDKLMSNPHLEIEQSKLCA